MENFEWTDSKARLLHWFLLRENAEDITDELMDQFKKDNTDNLPTEADITYGNHTKSEAMKEEFEVGDLIWNEDKTEVAWLVRPEGKWKLHKRKYLPYYQLIKEELSPMDAAWESWRESNPNSVGGFMDEIKVFTFAWNAAQKHFTKQDKQ